MARPGAKAEQTINISLIGADTMLGKDIQAALNARGNRVRIKSYSASGEGSFGEQEGEAVYLEPFNAKAATGEHVVILAGSQSGAEKGAAESGAATRKPILVDALGSLAKVGDELLASSLLGEIKPKRGQIVVLAHPVSSALTLLVSRLSKYQTPVRLVANVLEPASERGQKGINELHKQTAALLAFKTLPKDVFDAQIAFNTLARLGEDATPSLADTETRILNQIVKLSAQMGSQAAVSVLSLRLVQASVFHGYSVSLFAEFGGRVDGKALEHALACAQIEVRSLGEETPDSVGSAAVSGLIAGDIRVDATNPRAAWIWVVFDNLRLISDSVADLVSSLRQTTV